jgi:catechol 2,3-dioxygenase-like lactoylglutathione lyase family enzyme
MAKLRHIAIKCDDLESAAEFYKSVFGLEEMSRIDVAQTGEGAIYLSDGTINLALIKITRPEFPNYAPDGLNHIGFIVDDVQATVQKALEHGATVALPGDQIRPGEDWEFKMRSPDGVGLDLYDGKGRGWPGISSLEDMGITGRTSADGHLAGRPISGS